MRGERSRITSYNVCYTKLLRVIVFLEHPNTYILYLARRIFMSARGTILLVDDEKEIIKLMDIYLKNEGYNLLKASDGQEALDILERHPVDLIVLDRNNFV